MLCIDVQIILILLSHNGMAPIKKKKNIDCKLPDDDTIVSKHVGVW
jgi:hypothetical protein